MKTFAGLACVLVGCASARESTMDVPATDAGTPDVVPIAKEASAPDAAPAEDAAPPPAVTVTIPTSVSAHPEQIYFGKFVAHAMNWGFIWLDTVAFTAGYVAALGYCNALVGPPVTGWYVVGDCNGISTIASDGATITVNNYNGQCNAVQHGCGGERGAFVAFPFKVGTWEFLGNTNNFAQDSGQATDPKGRAWQVVVLDPHNYMWRVCADTSCKTLAM